jgi:hypothetical protein
MPSKLVNLKRQLIWRDYKGQVTPPNSTFAAATSMNFTVSRPTFVPSGGRFLLVDQVTVTVVFNGTASWVRPEINTISSQQQQFLLDHEQGHYDICALSARDCFIRLMSLKSTTSPDIASGTRDFDYYFNLHHDRWTKIDAEYDSQTGHSQASVFTPSTNLFTPPPQKGGPQLNWEGLIYRAFHTVRVTGEVAPDGQPYKMELLDVLSNASITIHP